MTAAVSLIRDSMTRLMEDRIEGAWAVAGQPGNHDAACGRAELRVASSCSWSGLISAQCSNWALLLFQHEDSSVWGQRFPGSSGDFRRCWCQ